MLNSNALLLNYLESFAFNAVQFLVWFKAGSIVEAILVLHCTKKVLLHIIKDKQKALKFTDQM